MIFEEEKLQIELLKLNLNMQILFGLLCAERLDGCCWAFGQERKMDISVFQDGCEFVFSEISKKSFDARLEGQLYSSLEDSIPNSDDFGDPLSVQAQSGMLALLNTLKGIETKETGSFVEAAYLVVEALDNYDFFVHKKLTGETQTHNEFPLLNREISWQLECVALLERATTELDLVSIRILNRTYVVPPAV